MALTQSRVTALREPTEKSALTPQEEQVVRMRNGESMTSGAKIELASGANGALREKLLALEAQIIARAPEPRHPARLRLVPSSYRDV